VGTGFQQWPTARWKKDKHKPCKTNAYLLTKCWKIDQFDGFEFVSFAQKPKGGYFFWCVFDNGKEKKCCKYWKLW